MNHPDTEIHTRWAPSQFTFTSIIQPSCISVDQPNRISNKKPNVYVQVEPSIILNHTSYLLDNYTKYHTILTYDHDVLMSCSNARFYIVSDCWISPQYYNSIDVLKKQFKISTLAGSKYMNSAKGHLFRQTIHHQQNTLKEYPIVFFRSSVQIPRIMDYGNNPLLTTKDELFDTFQFAIIIENSEQRNYFTEKLIDCLITKTIPIYYGCPNIHQFFDTTGWIILESDDISILTSKLVALDSLYYAKYNDIIEKNFIKAKEYSNFYKNVDCSISREEYIYRIVYS